MDGWNSFLLGQTAYFSGAKMWVSAFLYPVFPKTRRRQQVALQENGQALAHAAPAFKERHETSPAIVAKWRFFVGEEPGLPKKWLHHPGWCILGKVDPKPGQWHAPILFPFGPGQDDKELVLAAVQQHGRETWKMWRFKKRNSEILNQDSNFNASMTMSWDSLGQLSFVLGTVSKRINEICCILLLQSSHWCSLWWVLG